MKKHTKRLLSIFAALLAALCVAATCLVGCGDKVLARPPEMAADYEGSGKALECWVAERPGGVVLGDWHYIPGTIGGKRYAGSEYDWDRPTGEEYDLPASRGRVVYTLTAYPDYSSGDSDTVTRIEITDPAVTVYGISCNSAIQDFVAVFGDLGCQTEHTERFATATYGKTRLSLTAVEGERILRISVEVTNKDGIVF